MTDIWDRERRARALITRRQALLNRLPGEIRAARDLTPDLRELILDEAITFTALEYDAPVTSSEQLERTVWDACAKRIRRARYQRAYDTVRAGFQRAEPDALDALEDGVDPVEQVIRRDEIQVAVEFAAQLSERERRVLAAKYRGSRHKPLGYPQIARQLELTELEVRSAERAVKQQIERFATILAAGRLCDFRGPAIAALASGDAGKRDALVARAHLNHCAPCTTAYKQHLHYLQSAAFQGKVAALLPVPMSATEKIRPGAGIRDALVDWITRPFAHDGAAHAAQMASSGVGRGAGTALAVKLAALCIGGASTVGVCVTTGVLPNPLHRPPKEERRSADDRQRAQRPDRLPTKVEAHLIPAPTPTPRPERRSQRRRPESSRSSAGAGTPAVIGGDPQQPIPQPAPTGAKEFEPSAGGPVPPAPVRRSGGGEFNP